MNKRTALLSVFHKTGIVEFAQALIELGFSIISSGGTAKHLKEAGLAVTDIAEISGLPPVLGHRVVTLVPHVHGGLLALPEHLDELTQLGYPWIDLVCVDLYPLEEEIAKPEATPRSVREKIDIGGPTMLSSGAKAPRIVVCDPADRMKVIEWLKQGSPDEDAFTTALAAKADGVVAGYRLASARYHSGGQIDGFIGKQVLACRYGENAWQTPAALFSTGSSDPLALNKFEVVAGAAPSYNNLCDLDRMLQTATHLASLPDAQSLCFAIAVKHGNPCGAGFAYTSSLRTDVLCRAIDGDRRAIFGGLMLTNFGITAEFAETILTHGMTGGGRRLLDGIVAPWFQPEAIEMLKRKGDKCRFLANPALSELTSASLDRAPRFRYVRGGFLRQPNYTFVLEWDKLMPDFQDDNDIYLAWAVGSTSNSNTITLVKYGMLIGNGVGQQDRVGCCELALKRAREASHDPKGAVAYSDSFFPFPDGPEVLINAGVRAILTTSGSVNDGKTREVCEKAGVRLYMLPDGEARGFFGH